MHKIIILLKCFYLVESLTITPLLAPQLKEISKIKLITLRSQNSDLNEEGSFSLKTNGKGTLSNEDQNGSNDERKCFTFEDFKDPETIYTYAGEKKGYRFKMDQNDKLIDAFTTRRPVRRSVILPRSETIFEDDPSSLSERISQWIETPFEWDLISMSKNARKERLLSERAYARPGPFQKDNLSTPPSLKDLSPPEHKGFETFWITTPARILSFTVAYLSFPYITRFIDKFVSMPSAQLDEITSKFGPGISILYGTFVSLTLSILYRRQQTIQDDVAVETSMIVATIRSLLSLFRDDAVLSEEVGQCAADQIRILVKGSRGGELLGMMYSDPYARMLELIDCQEERYISQGKTDLGGKGSLIASCRDLLNQLYQLRARRLSNEALALPSTHFFVLGTLTALIFLSYAVSILPSVDSAGNPPNEASIIFGFLAFIYVIFYCFASDLNNPFSGVYQVRRSSTAAHLLELKWLVANHPALKNKVDFDEPKIESSIGMVDSDVVMIRSPGIGDLLFEREAIYPDSDINKLSSET